MISGGRVSLLVALAAGFGCFVCMSGWGWGAAVLCFVFAGELIWLVVCWGRYGTELDLLLRR